jgi:hypothetical protein
MANLAWPRSVSISTLGKIGAPVASTEGVTSPAAGFAGTD